MYKQIYLCRVYWLYIRISSIFVHMYICVDICTWNTYIHMYVDVFACAFVFRVWCENVRVFACVLLCWERECALARKYVCGRAFFSFPPLFSLCASICVRVCACVCAHIIMHAHMFVGIQACARHMHSGMHTYTQKYTDRQTERVCCLLVLNLVSSTLPCIRQPGPRLTDSQTHAYTIHRHTQRQTDRRTHAYACANIHAYIFHGFNRSWIQTNTYITE